MSHNFEYFSQPVYGLQGMTDGARILLIEADQGAGYFRAILLFSFWAINVELVEFWFMVKPLTASPDDKVYKIYVTIFKNWQS